MGPASWLKLHGTSTFTKGASNEYGGFTHINTCGVFAAVNR
jgi:hypothetical protein